MFTLEYFFLIESPEKKDRHNVEHNILVNCKACLHCL